MQPGCNIKSPKGLKALEESFNRAPDKQKKITEALREIDVAARLLEAGMSVDDVQRILGDRHLDYERKYFYDWLRNRSD